MSYRAFWQRSCRAAAAGAVLKPQGGNCAVLPKVSCRCGGRKRGTGKMNFVFISPHFPENYWNFCDRLRANGVNVLGIGDAPYETLPALLKSALTEYYRVDNMENYDEMLRAMGFFTFKYGKIDWVESNNEYWLEQDARLRTDFNITTGIKSAEIEKFKRKSVMKTYYQKAGIPTARWCVTADVTEAQAFAKTVGWPVIAKPDNGVGANGTHKFKNKTELNKFFQQEGPNAANYILEEFVDGEIVTFDGVADANAEPIYAASHVTPDSIMEIAHGKKPMWYYVAPEISPELRKMGEAALKAFGAKSRFFHLEFFRLKTAKPSLGHYGFCQYQENVSSMLFFLLVRFLQSHQELSLPASCFLMTCGILSQIYVPHPEPLL
mgnify:CR=1 FL=1